MVLETWLLYVVTVFFVSATPGPNMLLALNHGIRFGVRHTLPTIFGLLTALGLIMTGSALGLGALLATSELAFSVVKYAGAGYLIWLGIKTWRATPAPLDTGSHGAAPQGSPWRRFATGFLVAMSNPKAFLFFAALFPQFMNASLPQGPQLAVLAATFYVIESSWQFAYASGGARLRHWLSSPLRLKWINRASGGAFGLAGVALTSITRH